MQRIVVDAWPYHPFRKNMVRILPHDPMSAGLLYVREGTATQSNEPTIQPHIERNERIELTSHC